MGVVYKIKEDIRDFIINEKRANPQLSCRLLVDYVYKTFDITLSKSSINNLLKKTNLSSPVGRRPSGKAPRRKFKLPEKRKNQIFPKRDKEAVVYSSSRLDINKKSDEASFETISSDVALPKTQAKPVFRTVSECDGVGNFLLRAAQWELLGESFLGPFLREFTKGTSSMDLDAIGDLFVYLTLFGIRDIGELDNYDKQGLWFLLNVTQKIDSATLGNVLNGIQDVRSLAIKLLVEIKQKVQLVKSIRFVFEDMSELHLDPRMYSVWEGNVQSGFFLSLNKALNIVTKTIIGNVQSATIHSPFLLAMNNNQNTNMLPEAFTWFIQAFEGSKEKIIQKISLLDINNNEIVSFEVIPVKKRHWMCGIWPTQGLYSELIRLKATKYHKIDEKNAQYFHLLNLSSEVYEAQVRFRANLPNLTAIILKQENHEKPSCVILTNARSDYNPYDLVRRFFCQWPIENQLEHTTQNTDFNAFLEKLSDNFFATYLMAIQYERKKIFDWILEIIHEYTKIRYLKEKNENLTFFIEEISSKIGICEIFDDLMLVRSKSDSKSISHQLSPFSYPIKLFNKNLKII